MPYLSLRGRRPFERASKIAHAQVINDVAVQALLSDCILPKPADKKIVTDLAVPVPLPNNSGITSVVAIDGGYTETFVRQEFPSASITFFSFGPLLFKLADLRALDIQPFIAPEDWVKLKQLERFSFALPTRNITRKGRSLQRSVRETLNDFLGRTPKPPEPSLLEALRWLLFRSWSPKAGAVWTLPSCPNGNCGAEGIELTPKSPDVGACALCGGPIFLVDALRLHERVDEDLGAGGILSYVMTTFEQLVLIHLIKTLWNLKPSTLRDIVFIKDGPLAFFGQTSPLRRPMRELATFLRDAGQKEGGGPYLRVIGLEKTGAFVEHAMQIEDHLPVGSALVLSNDYIYRYIVPGDPESPDPYGENTYWGSKLIYKAGDGSVYVATVPTGEFTPTPKLDDFVNLPAILDVVASLRCSMYDNALIPIALVNRLVSLSDFPSQQILQHFAQAQVY
jgi:hypothetical protein